LAGVRRGLSPGSARSSGARGGGGMLEPNTKPSCRGSVLDNKRWGGALDQVEGPWVWLGVCSCGGRGAVNGLICWGGSPGCPLSLSFSCLIPTSKSPPLTPSPSYLIPSGSLGTGYGCLCWVVVERRARERLQNAHQSRSDLSGFKAVYFR